MVTERHMGRMKLIIPGAPVSQKRARIFQAGKRTVAWDPSSKEKENIRNIICSQMNGEFFAKSGPLFDAGSDITVFFRFYMPIPKSWPKSKIKRFKEIPHLVKYDIDNMIKAILDAMNDLIYKDDSCVTCLSACKEYSDSPRTEIDVHLTQKDQS